MPQGAAKPTHTPQHLVPFSKVRPGLALDHTQEVKKVGRRGGVPNTGFFREANREGPLQTGGGAFKPACDPVGRG